MLILEAGEICPFANRCPHSNSTITNEPCYGTIPSRNNRFTCEYVQNGQLITDGTTPRIPGDKTGKMKIIMD